MLEGGTLVLLAAIDGRIATALIVGGGFAIFALLLLATAAGELRGRRKAKVPVALRPGPSDEELEKSVIERYLLWGSAATLLMALWLPAYWLREPTRLAEAAEKFQTREVAEGERLYADLCATCHGERAEGGLRNILIDGVEHPLAEPPLRIIYSRYLAAGRSEDEITQLILDAINRGRPGTPMPTWALAFGGPMNSAQVDNVVLYLQSIQEEASFPGTSDPKDGAAIFAANCAVCHGANGEGGAGPNLQVAFERLSADAIAETLRVGRLNVNRPSMPAWAALGDEAIESLVRFIESIQRSAR